MTLAHEFDHTNKSEVDQFHIKKAHNSVLHALQEESRRDSTRCVALSRSIVIGIKDEWGIRIYEVPNGYKEYHYE